MNFNKDSFFIVHFNNIILLAVMIFLIKTIGAKPIEKQIKKFNPDFCEYKTSLIVKYVHKYSLENNLDPHLLTAILIQESSLSLGALNLSSDDYGIGQINKRTAAHFCPNKELLLTNYSYSIGCAAKVLADFKNRYAKKERYWWTRYNSSNPKLRRIYRKRVTKHFWRGK
jgi:hypothetical protein